MWLGITIYTVGLITTWVLVDSCIDIKKELFYSSTSTPVYYYKWRWETDWKECKIDKSAIQGWNIVLWPIILLYILVSYIRTKE